MLTASSLALLEEARCYCSEAIDTELSIGTMMKLGHGGKFEYKRLFDGNGYNWANSAIYMLRGLGGF